ncbi:hypothetical protein INP83_13990 [Mucilaginibacter sp. 21P]|nr:hypothetical protein [Mucilaginibacter sp. 21P]QXV64201.1 hypothetical protein INP83_13990 [Mucilaginibacter sp. 21P]
MRIEPKIVEQKEACDEFAELKPLQQRSRKAAIWLAFVGVFIWAAKILFF